MEVSTNGKDKESGIYIRRNCKKIQEADSAIEQAQETAKSLRSRKKKLTKERELTCRLLTLKRGFPA